MKYAIWDDNFKQYWNGKYKKSGNGVYCQPRLTGVGYPNRAKIINVPIVYMTRERAEKGREAMLNNIDDFYKENYNFRVVEYDKNK